MTREESFARAKAFSDFIGFHVRCVFLIGIAWFGLAPHMSRMYVALKADGEFVATPLRLEVLTFFFLYGFALAMFGFILVTVYRHFLDDSEASSLEARVDTKDYHVFLRFE